MFEDGRGREGVGGKVREFQLYKGSGEAVEGIQSEKQERQFCLKIILVRCGKWTGDKRGRVPRRRLWLSRQEVMEAIPQ